MTINVYGWAQQRCLPSGLVNQYGAAFITRSQAGPWACPLTQSHRTPAAGVPSQQPDHLVVEVLGHGVGVVVLHEAAEVELARDLLPAPAASQSEVSIVSCSPPIRAHLPASLDLLSMVTTRLVLLSPSLHAV